MRRTDEDLTTQLAGRPAHEAGPALPTAYDVWLQHAELLHQLRSVHAGLALSTDLLLEAARLADGQTAWRLGDLDPGRLLHLQAGEVAHLGRLLQASAGTALGHDRCPPEQEPQSDLAEVVDLAVDVARLHGQQVAWAGTSVRRRVAARPAREVLQVVLENARVHAAGAPVDLEVVEDGGAVLVRVRDHGPGLPRRRRPPEAGHGLGLRIAAEAAEDLGARLVAEQSDHGACFVLALPAREDAEAGHPEWGGTSWSACPA